MNEGSIGWFIDTVILGDMRRMVYETDLQYLSFGVLASGIEFLGGCIDCRAMETTGRSRTRFEKALRRFFPSSYRPFVGSRKKHDLYANLRCGMLHVVRPGGAVLFTTRVQNSHAHLSIDQRSGQLILVAEDLYDDLASAAVQLKGQLAQGKHGVSLETSYLHLVRASVDPESA